MQQIIIPGKATYAPVALTDVMVGAPFASRLLLGASVPGQIVAAASLGYYAGSAARDQWARRSVRPIDFQAAFGADVFSLEPMPLEARRWEVKLLGHALNAGYVATKPPRRVLARTVDRHLTAYIASITGQELITSTEVRSFNLSRLLMPSALGTCDAISGDVAIFQDLGVLEPHVIAHEFCHRKGYLKELHAQALSYLALRGSGDPLLVQAARIERLHRQLRVIQRMEPARPAEHLVHDAMLRPELERYVLQIVPEADQAKGVSARLYDLRMRMTGQNGVTDYDEGFTNFLWTFSRSADATQPTEQAAV